MSEVKKGCNHCIDPDGFLCYPIYGLGPHKHDLSKTGTFIGSTVMTEDKPNNFRESKEEPGMGLWYCPNVECDCSINNYENENR